MRTYYWGLIILGLSGCVSSPKQPALPQDYSEYYFISDCDWSWVTDYKACQKAVRQNYPRKKADNIRVAKEIARTHPHFTETFVLTTIPVNQRGDTVPYTAFTLVDVTRGTPNILLFGHTDYFYSLMIADPGLDKNQLVTGMRLPKVVECGGLSDERQVITSTFYVITAVNCDDLKLAHP